jgi:integrating conjugative element protein (TIGR03749 family)
VVSASRIPPKLNAPLPVVLTRYAAQSVYGPLRTVESVPGSARLAEIAWAYHHAHAGRDRHDNPSGGLDPPGSSVVAMQVRNNSSDKIVLDPRRLQGQFLSATFQHRWLGRAGTPEDTTVLYLVTAGRPEAALIAELPEPAPAKSGSRRNVK